MRITIVNPLVTHRFHRVPSVVDCNVLSRCLVAYRRHSRIGCLSNCLIPFSSTVPLYNAPQNLGFLWATWLGFSLPVLYAPNITDPQLVCQSFCEIVTITSETLTVSLDICYNWVQVRYIYSSKKTRTLLYSTTVLNSILTHLILSW